MPALLLAPDEPAPVAVYNEGARSPFVIVCDHAGKSLPRALGDLGVRAEDRLSHIAWDIGAAEVAQLLADELDAILFRQHYSRLVIDCNRPLVAKDSIPEVTGGIAVPGNQGLSSVEVTARIDEIFSPYHDRIGKELERRRSEAPYLFLSMHSFTPVLYGAARPYHAGVLYHEDRRLAAPLLESLRAEPGLVVGDNEPYRASPTTDYSIIEHAQNHGIAYVELEVRQDLISEAHGQLQWARRLARSIRAAVTAAGL